METKEARAFLYHKAIAKFGPDSQIMMLFEEMAELQKAVCKYGRTDGEQGWDEIQKSIIDEIADVTIMLEQMVQVFGINQSDLDSRISFKLQRLFERVVGPKE